MDEHYASPNDVARLEEADEAEARWAAILASRAEMPPEVRAVASLRDKRIPGLDAMGEAWGQLPAATQDRIGTQAVALAFYGWLSGDSCTEPAKRWLTDAATGDCDDRANTALNLIHDLAGSSLPALYGTKHQEPEWAHVGGGHHTDPVDMDWGTTATPTPISLAITLHRRAWQTLQASNDLLVATGRTDRRSLVWPALEAEDEALTDLLMLSVRSR